MIKLVSRRILLMLPVLVLVSAMTFGLILLVPGDAALTLAGENATPERIEEIRDRLGLDDPMITQYGRWLSKAVRGDFGDSLVSRQPVTALIGARMPPTLSLAAGALAVGVPLGALAGILAALRRGRATDRAITLTAVLGLAVPNYFLGMLLVLFFALWNPWLPATGYVPLGENVGEWIRHLLLPCTALGVVTAAIVMRQLRSSMIGVLGEEYVRTARAKGLRMHSVVLKHALRNAAIPTVTVVGAQVGYLIGGAVVIEQVFGIPGIGQAFINGVLARDMPIIQAVVMMVTAVVLAVNLLVDLAYGWLNPKVRVQ